MIFALIPPFFFAYLIGSIPCGFLLTYISGLGDIRDIGSGNIGATNVLRTGNKKLAALTLVCDVLKGFLAVYFAQYLSYMDIVPLIAGLLCILAHIFPVWLRFKGGKGVATALGTLFAFSPAFGLWIIALWLIIFALKRISSLSALSAFTIGTITNAAYTQVDKLYLLAITLLLFFTHRANIKRLINGTEPGWSTHDKSP